MAHTLQCTPEALIAHTMPSSAEAPRRTSHPAGESQSTAKKNGAEISDTA